MLDGCEKKEAGGNYNENIEGPQSEWIKVNRNEKRSIDSYNDLNLVLARWPVPLLRDPSLKQGKTQCRRLDEVENMWILFEDTSKTQRSSRQVFHNLTLLSLLGRRLTICKRIGSEKHSQTENGIGATTLVDLS